MWNVWDVKPCREQNSRMGSSVKSKPGTGELISKDQFNWILNDDSEELVYEPISLDNTATILWGHILIPLIPCVCLLSMFIYPSVWPVISPRFGLDWNSYTGQSNLHGYVNTESTCDRQNMFFNTTKYFFMCRIGTGEWPTLTFNTIWKNTVI